MTDTITPGTPPRTIGSTSSPRTRASVRTLGIGLGIGVVLGVVVNAIVFAVGNLGAPVQIATGGEPNVADLALVDVVVASIVWLVIGAVGLWVSEKLFARGFLIWAIGAAVIAAASLVPLVALDVDAGSKVTLAVLHVVVAAAAIGGQAVARRRAA